METKKCQLCGSKDLRMIIDLDYHPLADTFLKEEQLKEEEIFYPLRVLSCQNCGYATLQYVVPAPLRYQKSDYSYTSSNSPVAIQHFCDMASEVISRAGVSTKDLVVDIGSNVGTLLKAFREQIKCRVIGVEPASNIAKIAKKNKIPTIENFFNREAVKQILKKEKAKAIVCTNTFNHINDLNEFMANITELLANDGFFIFEVPYLLTLVQKTAFDTIYLEHISYFSIKPFAKFFKKFGLAISYAQHNDYMGGSIRVYAGKKQTDSASVKKYCDLEDKVKIHEAETYKDFMTKVNNLKFTLNRQIYTIKAKGQRIIGIGAATKGNTLLNYCKIDNTMLDFVTDSSPLKIGKFTPGSHIPIKPDCEINSSIEYALILPWNIASFLKNKLKPYNLKFLIPQIKR